MTDNRTTDKRPTENSEKPRGIMYKNGRIYFTKQMERKACFFMTISMLILGIVYYAAGF